MESENQTKEEKTSGTLHLQCRGTALVHTNTHCSDGPGTKNLGTGRIRVKVFLVPGRPGTRMIPTGLPMIMYIPNIFFSDFFTDFFPDFFPDFFQKVRF